MAVSSDQLFERAFNALYQGDPGVAAIKAKAGTYENFAGDASLANRKNQLRQSVTQQVDGMTTAQRDAWSITVLRRAQSYTPLEQPDGQQLGNKASALRDLVLGRAGSWRGAAFGVSGSGSGGF